LYFVINDFNRYILFLSGVANCFQSAKEKASTMLSHPKFQHCKLVLGFIVFKFLLSTLDIVTDLLTAREFFSNGHFYWGLLTILLIFAPFGATVIHTCIRIAMCFKIRKDSNLPIFQRLTLEKNEGRLKVLFKEMPSFLWNFPLFQPIRQAKIPF
jgi:hypothetical protein